MQKLNNSLSLEKKKPNIGIDLLGSDIASSALLDALLSSYDRLSQETDITLFLKKEDLTKAIPSSVHVVLATEAITMEDHPLSVLRKKKNSSIAIGMQMVKEKKIDAFISSGNTGAILAAAKTTLKTMKGVQRPALLALIPAKNKKVAALDVGASAKCRPSQLLQFAKLGIAFQIAEGITKPTTGLLNIGSEEGKGAPEHRAAYEALAKINPSYATFLGNVEGRDVFSGPVDVLVTDGFTGNVFLKTAEGIGAFLLSELAAVIKNSPSSSLQEDSFLPYLKKRFDYSEYPGALLCGVKGIVLKCHGSASAKSFESSIKQALALIHSNTLEKISSLLPLL